VPKNAGTSILSQFASTGKLVGGKEITREEKQRKAKHAHENGLKLLPFNSHTLHNKASFWQWTQETNGLSPVAILRNPWSRCLSLYLFNLKITQENIQEEWARMDHPRLILEGFKQSWMPGGFFVDHHAKEVEYSEETGRAWGQGDDQFSWLEGVEEARWFRMEDQLEDFGKFTGIKNIPHINTTSKTNYRSYYDDELRDRIHDIFWRDIELGQYFF
jgi:hypothetical protein